MRVSVIIPVYNAANFIADAVDSALAQSETGQVLIVEDGSTDDSLKVCRKLAGRHARVTLLRHAKGRNRGVAASRNLGISSAECEYIAFLDADDVYLPGRFRAARRILTTDRSIDGVYDAIGTMHADAEVSAWYRDQAHPELLTITEPIPPGELFETLVSGDRGFFCTDGIVVSSTLLRRTGGFDESLRMGEDTVMWVRMAVVGRLAAGCLTEPVGLRRLHATNTIYQSRHKNAFYAVRMAESLLAWGRRHSLPRRRMILLTDWLFNFQLQADNDVPYVRRKMRHFGFYLRFGLRHPLALQSSHYWRVVGASLGLKRRRSTPGTLAPQAQTYASRNGRAARAGLGALHAHE